MPLSLQAKILRALQEKEVEKIGGNSSITIRVRIIAATNKDLEQLVRDGNFREDLYYRLNVLCITIPPLRARKSDIPSIVNHIVDKLNKQGFFISGISPEAMRVLLQYDWPGNVRELQNVLERAANYTSNGIIEEHNLPEILSSLGNCLQPIPKKNESLGLQENKFVTEKHLIQAALEEAGGNKTKASQLLGISRTWLYSKMKKYNIT